MICASPNALTDKNLYSYCDNNPVMRRDDGGQFWDTVFDVVSLVFSVADVVANPVDPWAWAGLHLTSLTYCLLFRDLAKPQRLSVQAL